MSGPIECPERLADVPAERDLVGVSALLRAAATPPKALSSLARQRMRGRLYAALSARGAATRPRSRMAFLLVLTLLVGGVVGAATHQALVERGTTTTTVDAQTPAVAAKSRRSGRARRSASSPALLVETPESLGSVLEQPAPPAPAQEGPTQQATRAPEPDRSPALALATESARASTALAAPVTSGRNERNEPGQAPGARPASARRPQRWAAVSPTVRSRSVLAPRASASPDPSLAYAADTGARAQTEATLLAQAIRALRVDRDAGTALRVLDQRQAQFGDGTFRIEASAVRVEALLGLGRSQAALADLERLPLHAMPRRDEWHVVRGELRGQAGRWAEAEVDFSLVLAHLGHGVGAELTERALWGRSVARSQQGNHVGARQDALEYLHRFPGGRFAALAQRTLDTP
jgi:hypothetical protein